MANGMLCLHFNEIFDVTFPERADVQKYHEHKASLALPRSFPTEKKILRFGYKPRQQAQISVVMFRSSVSACLSKVLVETTKIWYFFFSYY